MKTITFYSYKGGVGRSLALSNIAQRLSQFKKKVCVIDFDLEAPGLEYKFKFYRKVRTSDLGLVDYIHQFTCKNNLPETITPYVQTLLPGNHIFTPIRFISAGDFTKPDYWKKLSEIHWNDLFHAEGNGVRFFLDLKAKIHQEINPDFLLIDSCTGITDISGITLRLFADDVVILAVNNDENIIGTNMVVNAITSYNNILFNKIPKIHLVFTRLPFTEKDKTKENDTIRTLTNALKLRTKFDFNNILVIHSDRRLEELERPMIGDETDLETDKVSIAKDYLKLFDVLTNGVLTSEDIENYSRLREALQIFGKAANELDVNKKLELLNKVIMIDPNMSAPYLHRGQIFLDRKEFNSALMDYKKIEELQPNVAFVLSTIGTCYFELNDFKKALEYFDKSIKSGGENFDAYLGKSDILSKQGKIKEAIETLTEYIKSNVVVNPSVLNNRANFYRKSGDLPNAYKDIQKAISISPKTGLYFATLAEIFAADGKTEEFYFNLNLALSNAVQLEGLKTAIEIYEKFRTEPRFIELLERYNKDVNELFEV